jgi:hypothetical protein
LIKVWYEVLLIVRFSKRPDDLLGFFRLVEGSRSQAMGSFQPFQRLTASFVHAATMAGHRSKVQPRAGVIGAAMVPGVPIVQSSSHSTGDLDSS